MRAQTMSFLVIFVVGTIIVSTWELVQWVRTGGHPNRRNSSEVLAEASGELLEREASIRTVRATGTLKRMAWDPAGKTWAYAGENSSSCTYEYGPAGRARAMHGRDVRRQPHAEAEFIASEFVSVWDCKIGQTLVSQEGALNSAPIGKVSVVLGLDRPERIETSDCASGWHYTIFGRWVGGGEGGMIFSDLLDGREDGTIVTGEDVDVDMTPLLLITVARGYQIDRFWLDINRGYALWRWEVRETAPQAQNSRGENSVGRLVRDARITDFWKLNAKLFYPRRIESNAYAPDGTPTERELIEITNISLDAKVGGDDLTLMPLPAGVVWVQQPTGDEKKLNGSAESNTQAIAEMRQAIK